MMFDIVVIAWYYLNHDDTTLIHSTCHSISRNWKEGKIMEGFKTVFGTLVDVVDQTNDAEDKKRTGWTKKWAKASSHGHVWPRL